MNALEWLRTEPDQPVRPVYTVHGDDLHLIRESIQEIARRVLPDEDRESGITRFAGSTASLATVLDEVCTLPFFSRRRLVIVDEADTFVTKNRKDLEAYVSCPSQSGTLVLQVKHWTSTTILAQLVEKHGLAINASTPREAELVKWLPELARTRFDCTLSPDCARLLLELVGAETGLLVSDLDKLAIYVGDAKRIERADILALVGAGRVETIWKALDAATTGQARVALEQLDHLLAGGEQPTPMLAAMSTSLLKIHHAGRLRRERLAIGEACQRAGMPPFAVEQTRKQHAHLGPARVDRLPAMLLKADLDIKGGSTLDPRTILELLFIELSKPRAD
jgi:DNA polymerase-3 subunit delta